MLRTIKQWIVLLHFLLRTEVLQSAVEILKSNDDEHSQIQLK